MPLKTTAVTGGGGWGGGGISVVAELNRFGNAESSQKIRQLRRWPEKPRQLFRHTIAAASEARIV